MNRFIKENLTLFNIMVIGFVVSLAFGAFNPFTMSSSKDGGLGFGQLMSVLLIPMLFNKYKKGFINNLKFRTWQKPLITFYCISLFSVLIMATKISTDLIVSWTKLLMGIMVCLFIPSLYRNKYILNVSLFAYSIICVVICLFVLLGGMTEYCELRHGRLWLWGENPNSTSTRWVLAIIYLINMCVDNPFRLGKIRILIIPMIIPLFLMIMMSGSRGSFLIAVLSVFLSIITIIKRNPRSTLVLVLLSCLVTYCAILNFDIAQYSIFERINETIESNEEDIRTKLIKASWNIFYDYPILGVGEVDYISEMMKYGHDHYAHNLYIHILTINGILGFVPFMIFTCKLFKGCLNILKKNSLPFVLLVYMFLIASKTGGILTYLFMWYVYGLVASFVNNEYETN